MKLGICIDCEKKSSISTRNQYLIAGRCRTHYIEYRRVMCAERKKLRNKEKNSRNIPATFPQPNKSLNLVYWYENRMLECEGRCAECGQRILPFDRHSSIAHVLPKKENHGFPSVATHPLNSLELGPRCGCHNRYDVSWLSASKMKIFPEAIEIAVTLYPLLTREEQARFPEVFEVHLL